MAAVAVLTGCGFAPAFGTNGSAQTLQNAVAVTAPDTVLGFNIRARINDRLGITTTPRFGLDIAVTTTQEAGAVTIEGDITRFQIIGVADWVFTTASGAGITQGRAETFASYSATGSTVATQAAATDARARLATALADQIVSALILADLP